MAATLIPRTGIVPAFNKSVGSEKPPYRCISDSMYILKAEVTKLVQQMHGIGLSVSYNRVMGLENSLALGVSQRYMTDGMDCPASLGRGIYTVGELDNLDDNPLSNTSKGSFHGTGISIFQMPTTKHDGEEREPIKLPDNTKGVLQLLDRYTIVPTVQCVN